MKVLAVDDQPEALKQIRRAVENAEGPDGTLYEVEATTDHREALELLDEQRFDVVITDMVMGADEEEGLDILSRLTDKSPITIVLTAYASIRNCVKAMRAGAWDYLEKNPAEGDAYDNLLDSLDEACRRRLQSDRAGRSSADARWVHENMDQLIDQYPGRVIAVLDEEVVAEGESYDEVKAKVNEDAPVAQPAIVSIPDTRIEAIE